MTARAMPASRVPRLATVWVLLLGLILAAGCGQVPPAPSEPVVSPFAPCPAPAGPSGPPSAPGATSAGDRQLPTVALPCFTGGESIDLARLGRPAVINFWASSCGPCRKELPQLQRFADEVSGQLVVIGVATRDTRRAAAAAGEDFGVRFPVLFDPDASLLTAWGRSVLPVTLFVDARGGVRHEDLSGALTAQQASELATQYLGVTG